MGKRYRHPTLGEFHRVDLSKGSIGTTMVSDAALAGLVRYLNEGEAQGKSKRIIRILEEMLELEKVEEPVWGETKEERDFSSGQGARPMFVTRRGESVPNPLLRKLGPEKYRRQLEIEERKSLLNRKLARYRFLPYAWPSQGGQWVVVWRIQHRAPQKRKVHHRGIMQLDDAAPLQMILDLARARYLNRLRKCSHCHKWLYAIYRHQRFCSTSCQQKYYRGSEEQRKYRREYMRNYRS